MPGSFYYRPVDPGYGELGATLGRGLEMIGAGIAARRARKQDEAAQRRAERRQDALFDIEIAGMGGGRGYAPTISNRPPELLGPAPLPSPGPGIDEGFLKTPERNPLLDPESWMGPRPPAPVGSGVGLRGRGFEPMPLQRDTMRPAVTSPDPRFVQLGDQEAPFYIENPEVRGTRMAQATSLRKLAEKYGEAEIESEIKEKENERRIARLVPAIMLEDPKSSIGEATARARMMVDDIAKWTDIYPSETWTPRPGAENYALFSNRGGTRLTDIAIPPSERTGAGGVTPTSRFTQRAIVARQLLSQLNQLDQEFFVYGMDPAEYDDYRSRILNRYGMTEAEARDMIFRGGEEGFDEEEESEEGALPPAPGLRREPPAAAPAPAAGGRLTPGTRIQMPPEIPGFAARPKPAPKPKGDEDEEEEESISQTEINGIMARLAKYPRDTWEKRLRASGYSAKQARNILAPKL